MSEETHKPDVWMPLYIGDYLKDTGRLSTEQHGAYLLLIMEYWQTGPIPDDDAELGSVTRLGVKEWKKTRQKLIRFFIVENGVWKHHRIDEELEKWSARKALASERARKGGLAKAASSRKKRASSTQQAVLKQCSSPSSTVERVSNKTLSHSADATPEALPDGASAIRPSLRLVEPAPVLIKDMSRDERKALTAEIRASLKRK